MDSDGTFQQLHRFVCQVDRSPTLQDMVVECRSPEEILAIAEKMGCSFSRQRLRKESCWLSAPYWPWAEKGQLTRVAFFSKG